MMPEPNSKEKIGPDFDKENELMNRFFVAVTEELETSKDISEAIRKVFHGDQFDYTGNVSMLSLIHFIEEKLEKKKIAAEEVDAKKAA